MSLSSRPQNSAELVDALHMQHERLCDACNHFDRDQKSPLGVANMAVPIRALACKGSGNNLILRVCSDYGLAIPSFKVSARPNQGIEATNSVGSIPIGDHDKFEGDTVTLEEFINRECLVIDAEHERITVTVGNFIKGIAEKRGYIHTDNNIPAYFDHLNTVQLSDMDLVEFFFRHTATAVSFSSHSVLGQLNRTNFSPAAPYEIPNKIRLFNSEWGGIPWLTDIQSTYQKRLVDASQLRAQGKSEEAKAIAESVLTECRDFKSLFYVRLLVAAKHEKALALFNLGHHYPARFILSNIWSEYHSSKDPGLRILAENSFKDYYMLFAR